VSKKGEADELDLLFQELRAAGQAKERNPLSAVIALLAKLPRGRRREIPTPTSAPVRTAESGDAAGALRVLPREPAAADPLPAVAAPRSSPAGSLLEAPSRLTVSAAAVPSGQHVAALARVFGEVAAELRRAYADGEDRLTEALAQVREREPRFARLSLSQPTAADVIGLLFVAELAIGPQPGRLAVFARRSWQQVRSRYAELLLDLYNAQALPEAEASEVEALWRRLAHEG
jgi:hypothetical protein